MGIRIKEGKLKPLKSPKPKKGEDSKKERDEKTRASDE